MNILANKCMSIARVSARFVELAAARFVDLDAAGRASPMPFVLAVLMISGTCVSPMAAMCETTCMTEELLMVPEPCAARKPPAKLHKTSSRKVQVSHKADAKKVVASASSSIESKVVSHADAIRTVAVHTN